jgi:hypothetical protein
VPSAVRRNQRCLRDRRPAGPHSKVRLACGSSARRW